MAKIVTSATGERNHHGWDVDLKPRPLATFAPPRFSIPPPCGEEIREGVSNAAEPPLPSPLPQGEGNPQVGGSEINHRSARGFTLIELVVVLAILVGLAAAFPMAMERLQPERQLRVYAQKVAADLREQRAQAMAHNQMATIAAQANSHAYTLEPGTGTRSLPDALSIALYPAAASSIAVPKLAFFADGSSSGGFVQLSRDQHRTRVRIAAFTGQVSVE